MLMYIGLIHFRYVVTHCYSVETGCVIHRCVTSFPVLMVTAQKKVHLSPSVAFDFPPFLNR